MWQIAQLLFQAIFIPSLQNSIRIAPGVGSNFYEEKDLSIYSFPQYSHLECTHSFLKTSKATFIQTKE